MINVAGNKLCVGVSLTDINNTARVAGTVRSTGATRGVGTAKSNGITGNAGKNSGKLAGSAGSAGSAVKSTQGTSKSSVNQSAKGPNAGQQNNKVGSGTNINTSTAGSYNSPVTNTVTNVSGNKIKIVIKDINQNTDFAQVLSGLVSSAQQQSALQKSLRKGAASTAASSTSKPILAGSSAPLTDASSSKPAVTTPTEKTVFSVGSLLGLGGSSNSEGPKLNENK